MATKKTGTKAAGKTGDGGAYKKDSRCWPGYVPVPGKSEHEEGSCRKEPASKNGGKAVDRETARKKQIAMGGKRAEQAKGKSPSAAERRSVSKAAGKKTAGRKTGSGTAAKAGVKKASGKKASAKKAAGKKAAGKRAPAKRSAAKKAPAKKAAARKAAAKKAAAKRAPRKSSAKTPRTRAARRS